MFVYISRSRDLELKTVSWLVVRVRPGRGVSPWGAVVWPPLSFCCPVPSARLAAACVRRAVARAGLPVFSCGHPVPTMTCFPSRPPSFLSSLQLPPGRSLHRCGAAGRPACQDSHRCGSAWSLQPFASSSYPFRHRLCPAPPPVPPHIPSGCCAPVPWGPQVWGCFLKASDSSEPQVFHAASPLPPVMVP